MSASVAFEPPVALELPAPAGADAAAATATLDAARAGRLRALAAPPEATLATALAVLAHRLGGASPIPVAVAEPGRVRLVGADLAGDPPFADALGRVGAALASAPAPGRGALARLAPVALVLDDARAPAGAQLALAVARDGEALRLRLEGDAASVERWLGHLCTLLGAAGERPRERVGALALLGPDERRALVEAGRASGAPLAAGLTLPELVARQAARTPDAVAVSLGEERLTYRELDERANWLALRLRELGARRETLVGVCLRRSLATAIAPIAVMRAGAAYVPVDPDDPPARSAAILRRTAAPLVVTERAAAELAAAGGGRTLALDELAWGSAARSPADGPAPGDLAYVVHTSGSTGEPKGVLVEHAGVASYVAYACARYGVGPGTVVLQLPSLAYDASVRDLLGPLTAGARVVLLPQEEARDPAAVLAAIRAHGVTALLSAVPSMLRELLALPEAEELRLELTVSSGESLRLGRAQARRAALGLLVNQYGPTEATMTSTLRVVPAGPLPARDLIGEPIPGRTAHVLDERLEPVPVGVAGELYLGGTGIARGYLGEPELTAASFVPDPFSREAGARLYRTGDLARRLADGTLELLGRADRQIKVRGHRVEAGEVEARLASHPGVAAAVVALRADARGEPLLAGWYVPVAGADPGPAALRAHVAAALPAAMVPQALRALERLPLTSTGKVDHRALPDPGPATGAGEPPRDALERLVAEAFAGELGAAAVGRDDAFLDLGGHSLLAARVAARLRDATGAGIGAAAVLEAGTVAALAARLREQGASGAPGADGAPGPEPIPVLERGGPLPLSAGQRRLWFLERLNPGGAEYVMHVAWRLRGPLDAGRLSAALGAVVARHEALRTRIVERGEEPVAVVDPPADLALAVEEAVDVDAVLAGERRRPFDLATGPLVRVRLLRAAPGEHVLSLALHHVIADGWSLDVIARELSAAYAGRPLGPAVAQHADAAAWLARRDHDAALAAAAERLRGTPPLELPTDRPRPHLRSGRGDAVRVELDAEHVSALGAVGRRHGATPYMALAAAYALLLGRLAGQGDVAIGTPVASRDDPRLEGSVGFFANTVVLRAQLDGARTFGELVERTRRAALDAYAGGHVPFERLVEELGAQRELSRTPLFQAMLVVDERPELPELGDVVVEPVRVAGGAAKFDLTLALAATPDGGLSGELEYASDLFDRATVERWAGHLRTLLARVVAEPERPLARVSLLSPAERERILGCWAGALAELPETTMHALVEEQASRTPGAVAVAWRGERLSYAELDARANRLANHLRALGAGPGELVGLALERTPDLVVAVLAVLKAGAAYLPLDPSYPAERLAFMARDGRVAALVAHRATASSVPVPAGTPVVRLDHGADAAAVAARPASAPAPAARPGDAAYVLYTSGSTGRPKGVVLTHRNAVYLASWAREALSAEDVRRVLLATSLNFDLSVFELLAALTRGGTLVVARDHLELTELGAESGVTLLNVVPSAMAELLRLGAVPASVRTVTIAGEPLTGELARRIHAETSAGRLVNLYGPTEATTYATGGEVAPDEALPSLGRPLPGVLAYVVDHHGEPVPVGVAGELLLGGDGITRGYLGRPALSAERYVPDGLSGRAGERLYRTGDLVRWRPDGRLDFVGRVDHQVKLHGFRIELGEVEAALRDAEGVAQAVATVREDSPGDRRLAAYAVPAAGARLDPDAVLAALRARLPRYMVPATLTVLERLPATPNGKVDRGALPAPAAPARAADAEPPRPGTEAELAAVFAGVLGVERVGRDESFFDLGGHSLLVTRAVARIAARLGVELPVRELFERPTVAALAPAVDARRADGAPGAIPLLPRGEPLPLSSGQRRLWFLEQLDPGSPEYVIGLGWRLRGALDPERLRAALAGLVARHEPLRTRIVVAGDEPAAVVDPPSALALPVEDVGGIAGALELAAEELRRPFDLAQGPPLRARLARIAADDHVLLLAMPHVASDGWSRDVIARELGELYAGRALEPLDVGYADLAAWEERRAASAHAGLAWWRDRLAGVPPLELPADRPRPALRSGRGASVEVEIPPALAGRLRALGRRHDATLYMTLLAALAVLLGRLAGQRDLAIGSPVAGRRRSEAERLVGFFASTIAVRADLRGAPTFAELLGRTRAAALDALEHADVPFERVVEALHPDRDLSRTPIFQAMLALADPPRAPALDGVRAEPLRLPAQTAKFDLTLLLEPAAGGGLSGELEYATDVFDRSTVERWAGHLRTLLEAAVRDPDGPIDRLALLTDAERERLVRVVGRGPRTPPPALVHERVREQARVRPDAVAVREAERSLGYGELHERATRLAAELRRRGVGPETRVGLCYPRSIELVVGMYAVLLAGGAYVPLDPTHPRRRLAAVAADAELALAIAPAASAERLPHGLPLVTGEEVERLPPAGGEVRVEVSPDTAAYVVFTSGSTGRPKGVVVHHAGFANVVEAKRRDLMDGDRRVLFAAAPTFDVAQGEVMMTLVDGATLHVPGEDELVGEPLLDLLEREAVENLTCTPSVLASVRPRPLPALRTVGAGGEACPRSVVAAWGAGRRFLNQYGPAEASIACTWSLLGPDRAPDIGRPIENVSVYVLDERREPVPIGVVGELHVGGVAVARGYAGRPDLTAERFVPDPFADEPGARMYATGDLARWRADGRLEFVGRRDGQVQLRGLRLELGEVEAALAEHPRVREAAAAVVEPAAGLARLVAWVVATDGGEVDARELRRSAAERLPSYMVPAEVISIAELPLTSHGKVDRAALPRPAREAGAGRPAASATERALAATWSDAMGLAAVGAEDDFFELGGDSLTAARAIRRLADRLGREVPVRLLFEHPRLDELAEAIDALIADPARAREASMPAEELVREAELPPDVRPPRRAARARRAADAPVLVTGAAGFLGAHLAHELARRRGGEVLCLVRASDEQGAAERLRAALAAFELPESPRLVALCGDVALPGLGLDAGRLDALAGSLAEVHHCAASVDLLAGYRALAPANVGGTREVLRLACRAPGAPVHVHHVSTVSVRAPAHGRAVGPEDALRRPEDAPRIGYTQTKWVAEQLVERARERGLPAWVHRPPRIGPSSATGAWSERDLLARLVIGSLRLGAAPALATTTNLVPVDALAAAIAAAAADEPATRDLVCAEAVGYADVFRAAGLEVVAVREWLAAAGRDGEPDPLLAPVLPIVRELAAAGPELPVATGRAAVTDAATALAAIRPALAWLGRRGLVDAALAVGSSPATAERSRS